MEKEEFSIDFDVFNQTNLRDIPYFEDNNIIEQLADLVSLYKNDIALYKQHKEFKNINIYLYENFIGFTYGSDSYFQRTWTDLEVICRPIIFDYTTAEIVCRGMNKFFNINETAISKKELVEKYSLDPEYDLTVSEKLDGTFVLIFKYQDKIYTTTRQGFETPQAKWVAKHFKYNYSTDYVPEGCTLFFEAIYKENYDQEFFIIKYLYEGIFLFGARYNYGQEFTYANLKLLSDHAAYQMVKFQKLSNIMNFIETSFKEKGVEGYVLNIYNINCKVSRVKLKTEFFIKSKTVRRKKGLSFSIIKEKLLTNKVNELYEIAEDHDEIILYIDDMISRIRDIVDKKVNEVLSEREAINKDKIWLNNGDKQQRSDFANVIMKNTDYCNNFEYHYMLYDGKDIYNTILKKVTKKQISGLK